MRNIAKRSAAAKRLVVAFSFLAALAIQSQAAEVRQEAVDRAAAFLNTQARGKEILALVHLGADYRGHRYLKATTDGTGEFELVYEFLWERDGWTDIGFRCNSNGFVYRLRIVDTNAVLTPPFAWAGLSIEALGHGIIEAYKDKLSEQQRRQLHEFVNKADAKGLLELELIVDQL